jgi:RNA polymerase sigma-70 factor (ECF subfamily)
MSTDPGAPARPALDAPPAIGDAWAHREELVAYSRRLLGAHADLAEDVVQEAYLRLHECAAAGDPVEEARPWLFRVARNLALDERRRGRRGDDVLSSLEVVSPGPRGPLEVLQ